MAVFPEAFLTGYCFRSREDAEAYAIPTDSRALVRLRKAAELLGVTVVVGFAEREDGFLFNSAALFSKTPCSCCICARVWR